MTEIQNIRKNLEKISEEHRLSCEKWARSPGNPSNEANHHDIYCDALDAAYQIVCTEMNVQYQPLQRRTVGA